MKHMFLGLLATLLLTTCGESRISRSYPCKFVLYTQYHNPSKVLTAITSAVYPVKVSVYKSSKGAYTVEMNSQDGKNNPERQAMTVQMEVYAYQGGIYLGANNSIIVCQNSYDARPVAYDGMCPNCISTYADTDFPLSWTAVAMQVRCPKCGRTYDLNTGSIVSGSKGDRLMEYAVSYDQSRQRLYIGN